jgi:hypothetical protein
MTATLVLGLLATGVAAVPARDGATIVNSGSTNFAGYAIEVWSDGTASVAAANRDGSPLSSPKPFTVDPSVAKKFFADLAAARSQGAATVPCMKSASFGSSTHVKWHGWTSPDLTCPPGNAAGAALVSDVETIVKLSGFSATPRRGLGPMRPMEPPGTPEPSPTSS